MIIRLFAALAPLWVSLGGTVDAQDEEQNLRAPRIAIHVGKILTCAGDAISNGTILIRDGKIAAVGENPTAGS